MRAGGPQLSNRQLSTKDYDQFDEANTAYQTKSSVVGREFLESVAKNEDEKMKKGNGD